MTTTELLERIPSLSVNPDMATREDVAEMAAHIMDLRQELWRLRTRRRGMSDEQGIREVPIVVCPSCGVICLDLEELHKPKKQEARDE